MATFELRTKTTVGELVIHFDKTEEIQEVLNSVDLKALEISVNEKLGAVLVREPRQPKPGLEFACRFTPDGRVELIRFPSSPVTTIGFVLYAYDPQPVDPLEVFEVGRCEAGNVH